MTDAGDRGHRVLAHTADEIVEAWGPTREACLEEAALGLVDTFADLSGATWGWEAELRLDGSDETLLVGLLEEVVFRLDSGDEVPVHVHVRRHGDGIAVSLWLTDVHRVRPTGAAPKGVSYSELLIEEERPGWWRCRATIDV